MSLKEVESIGPVWVSNTDWVTFWASGVSGPADVSEMDAGYTEMLFRSRIKSPGQSERSVSDPTGDVSIVTDAAGDGIVGVCDVSATL